MLINPHQKFHEACLSRRLNYLQTEKSVGGKPGKRVYVSICSYKSFNGTVHKHIVQLVDYRDSIDESHWFYKDQSLHRESGPAFEKKVDLGFGWQTREAASFLEGVKQ